MSTTYINIDCQGDDYRKMMEILDLMELYRIVSKEETPND